MVFLDKYRGFGWDSFYDKNGIIVCLIFVVVKDVYVWEYLDLDVCFLVLMKDKIWGLR